MEFTVDAAERDILRNSFAVLKVREGWKNNGGNFNSGCWMSREIREVKSAKVFLPAVRRSTRGFFQTPVASVA